MWRSRPDRTRQFDAPNGTTVMGWTLRSEKSWSFSAENPYLGVRGLLPNQRGYHSGHPPNFYLHDVTHRSATRARDRKRLFTSGRDREFYEPRFWRGRNQRDFRLRYSAWDVLQQRGHQAVGQIRRQVEVACRDLLLAVLVDRTDRDLAGGGVDRQIQRMRE